MQTEQDIIAHYAADAAIIAVWAAGYSQEVKMLARAS